MGAGRSLPSLSDRGSKFREADRHLWSTAVAML